MFSHLPFLKILFWVVGLAFLAACKIPATVSEAEKKIESDSTIVFLKSEKLTDSEKSRLMEGSKNCFLDSLQFEPSGVEILIENPSFEVAEIRTKNVGNFKTGMTIRKWIDVKNWINVAPFKEESSFDWQPGQFDVKRTAMHGFGFVGLVGRDNETNESMGQVLAQPLEVGKLYEWSLFVCRSEKYESISRSTNNAASYTKPLILKIWGGKKEGRADQLFAKTGPIENYGWQKICFVLKSKSACEAIYIEATHSDLVSKTAYNGNVLIDAVGAIREIGPTKN